MKNDVFAALSQKSEKRSETSVKGLSEMFGLSGDIKVTTLLISSLREKANHPFKVVADEKLNALAESIKANGLMEPIIVRPLVEGITLDYYEKTLSNGKTALVTDVFELLDGDKVTIILDEDGNFGLGNSLGHSIIRNLE